MSQIYAVCRSVLTAIQHDVVSVCVQEGTAHDWSLIVAMHRHTQTLQGFNKNYVGKMMDQVYNNATDGCKRMVTGCNDANVISVMHIRIAVLMMSRAFACSDANSTAMQTVQQCKEKQ